MAEDEFIAGKLAGHAVSPLARGREVADRPFVVRGVNGYAERKPPKRIDTQLNDGFSLEKVTPEIATKLLATSLMDLSEKDIAQSRLGMLKLTLEKILANQPLEKTDEETLSLAGAILRSAPRMITNELSHNAAEYKQEEIRELVDEFIAIASSWGVVIYKQIIRA